MSVNGKLRVIEGGKLGFWCPGCEEMHVVKIRSKNDKDGWIWNLDFNLPTFSPSVLIRSGHFVHKNADGSCWCTYNLEHKNDPAPFKCSLCHSFVIDGKISFLNDCTHKLAGKIVEMVVPDHDEV